MLDAKPRLPSAELTITVGEDGEPHIKVKDWQFTFVDGQQDRAFAGEVVMAVARWAAANVAPNAGHEFLPAIMANLPRPGVVISGGLEEEADG